MAGMTSFLDTLTINAEGGKCSIPVPWHHADILHQRLRQRGCPATLYLDPGPREARLEFWPTVDPNRVRQTLEALRVVLVPRAPS
jgi:hypothetical protein